MQKNEVLNLCLMKLGSSSTRLH